MASGGGCWAGVCQVDRSGRCAVRELEPVHRELGRHPGSAGGARLPLLRLHHLQVPTYLYTTRRTPTWLVQGERGLADASWSVCLSVSRKPYRYLLGTIICSVLAYSQLLYYATEIENGFSDISSAAS